MKNTNVQPKKSQALVPIPEQGEPLKTAPALTARPQDQLEAASPYAPWPASGERAPIAPGLTPALAIPVAIRNSVPAKITAAAAWRMGVQAVITSDGFLELQNLVQGTDNSEVIDQICLRIKGEVRNYIKIHANDDGEAEAIIEVCDNSTAELVHDAFQKWLADPGMKCRKTSLILHSEQVALARLRTVESALEDAERRYMPRK